MPKSRRSSGLGYLALIVIAVLVLLWVAGVIRVQLSPEVNVPPEVQTPVAQIPDIVTPLAQIPRALATLAATPSAAELTPAAAPALAPHPLAPRTKTSGCVAQNGLPDPACTPGAVVGVSKEQVCVPGYSSEVRDVSERVKNEVFAEYGITSHAAGEYEVDHLVSLELGGANDIANLWPEPADPRPGFHEKDKVENYLHAQLCNGSISLKDAQTQIAGNWLAVYQRLPAK
jgi:hypothetical protein